MSHLRQPRQDLAPGWHYCSDRVTTRDVPICPSLLQTRPPLITQLECEITSEMGSGRRGPAPLGDGIARSDRRVTSQAAISDALARLCLALSEQNVTFSLTSLPPSMSDGPLGRSAPRPFQSLVQLDPQVCTLFAIAKIGEHTPPLPPLRMGAIFAQFYSWDRRRIHKLTFIFADNPSLWDFKVRGAIAFDVPSNLLFITFWYHFCNRTMEHRSIALVRLFTEIATTKFIVLGRGVLPW